MVESEVVPNLMKLAKEYCFVLATGSSQPRKITVVRHFFRGCRYVNLEFWSDLEERREEQELAKLQADLDRL